MKIYGLFRPKTITDHFFNFGLCLSYDRILEFTKKYLMRRFNYELTNVFSPNPLRKSKFTEVAKDNKDFFLHFLLTSMTVMQFPSAENIGNDNSFLERTQLIEEQTKKARTKKPSSLPETYKTVKSLSIGKAPLYAPSVIVDISQYLDNGEFIN